MNYRSIHSKFYENQYYDLIETIIKKFGVVKGNDIITKNLGKIVVQGKSYWEIVYRSFLHCLQKDLGPAIATELIIIADNL